jgi:ADP-heptose:LPS heptosyltransferase
MATPTAFQVPPLDQRKRIPARVIRALAKHIAEKFDPEEIILFGSHAYGRP